MSAAEATVTEDSSDVTVMTVQLDDDQELAAVNSAHDTTTPATADSVQTGSNVASATHRSSFARPAFIPPNRKACKPKGPHGISFIQNAKHRREKTLKTGQVLCKKVNASRHGLICIELL